MNRSPLSGEPAYSMATLTVSPVPYGWSSLISSTSPLVLNVQAAWFGPDVTFATFSFDPQSSVSRSKYGDSGVNVCVTVPRTSLFLTSSVSSALMCLISTVRSRSGFRGVPGLANGRRVGVEVACPWAGSSRPIAAIPAASSTHVLMQTQRGRFDMMDPGRLRS